jgi:hypothetical protein
MARVVRFHLRAAQTREQVMALGIPSLVLADFEWLRVCTPPLGQVPYGLDLLNYLWHIKD